jgi:FRG domain
MYHFLVTAQEGAWDKPFYEYDRSRFLEYTSDAIAKTFEILTAKHIETLLKWPCLFAYEGTEGNVRIGQLRSIKERGRSILIEFDLRQDIPEIPFEAISAIAPLLDIRSWEMSRTHWALKEEDLMGRLVAANLIAGASGKAQESSRKSLEGLSDPKRRSSKVKTVGGFIEMVLRMQSDGKEMFYRGHSNKKKYKLEPSLFRRDERGNYLYLQHEHVLYRELLVSNSVDFTGDNYTLDRLVRMQHYSLPTRLLDITSNPLIALYFACKSNMGRLEGGKYVGEEEGEVIVFAVKREQIKYFDSDTASCIANLARLPKSEKEQIDHSIAEVKAFNEQKAIERLVHFVREEKSFFESRVEPTHLRTIVCVKGKRSNSRISSQSGAFLLFGIDAVLDEKGTPEIEVKRIGVSSKADVLKQLDLLNINESTVFPYIENSAKYVAQKYAFHE